MLRSVKQMKQMKSKIILLLFLSLSCTENPKIVDTTLVSVDKENPLSIRDKLQTKKLNEQTEYYFLESREIIPKTSSLYGNPVFLLGTIFFAVPKNNLTCKEAEEKKAFDYIRFKDYKKRKCETASDSVKDISSFVIKGENSIFLESILGKATLASSNILEMTVSQPASFVFKSPSACLPEKEQLKKLYLPYDDKTCHINYVIGVVLNQITYRKYTEFKGEATSSFSVISADGKLYNNVGETENRYILSTDFISVEQSGFDRDFKDGHLIPKRASPIVLSYSDDEIKKLKNKSNINSTELICISENICNISGDEINKIWQDPN
jgi:hypothetical protein